MDAKLITVFLVLIISGCVAAAGNSKVSHFGVDFDYSDDPSRGLIDLSYENKSRKSVCFGPENWPSNGTLLNNGSKVSLEINGQSYYLQAEQDYCPRCSVKVKPNGKLHGFLRYSSFNMPDSLSNEKKTLNYRLIGYSCPR